MNEKLHKHYICPWTFARRPNLDKLQISYKLVAKDMNELQKSCKHYVCLLEFSQEMNMDN
jgi:hypothetical protein